MAPINEKSSLSSDSIAAPKSPFSSDSNSKRSLDEGEELGEPAEKRQRITISHTPEASPQVELRELPSALRTPSLVNWDKKITAAICATPSFDDGVSDLQRRSVIAVLQGVGFDAASEEAVEAICSEMDSYAAHFLSYVSKSMLSSRRSQTTPIDFEYALRMEGLTAELLAPHLKPPIQLEFTHLHFELQELEEVLYQTPPILLGTELSGATEKSRQKYIPMKFPTFPGLHTFKSTEVKSERESDPRKIREKATEAARHGEEALRRLVNAGKAGDQRGAKKISEKSAKHKLRHQLWEETMSEMVNGNANTIVTNTEDGNEELCILIDAGKQYGRRTSTRAKKATDNNVQ